MNTHFSAVNPENSGPVWAVGALMQAISDALAARFNPVAVEGEISGFSRAASGHCYFNLKDSSGQIRCALFRRSAEGLGFAPREGMRVQARGKLDVYGPRGDLQLIVDRLQVAGQGQLYEEFLRLKARLTSLGLFDADRKRTLPPYPERVGIVTSLGAAALRDVVTALRRRAPHVGVVIFPALVQGTQAPGDIVSALSRAYAEHRVPDSPARCDVLLLVRGGGSLEDLWSFNDESVVRAVAEAPMPIICGVGHETDFTLADFAADLRAPTPTAAAELCAPERLAQLAALDDMQAELADAAASWLDRQAQKLDRAAQRLGRPSQRTASSHQHLLSLEHRLRSSRELWLTRQTHGLGRLQERLSGTVRAVLQAQQQRIAHHAHALTLLDPRLPLQRGYALMTDADGQLVSSVHRLLPGQAVTAALKDGELDLTVSEVRVSL
jgi:exodeoxyribonuclease VII large subunit